MLTMHAPLVLHHSKACLACGSSRCALMLITLQVNGGSQSFNAVNGLRILGRWMRMVTIPNQSSVPKVGLIAHVLLRTGLLPAFMIAAGCVALTPGQQCELHMAGLDGV